MDRKSLLSFLMAIVLVCSQANAFAAVATQDVGAGTVNVNDASTLYDDMGINFDDTNGRVNWFADGVDIGNDGTNSVTVAGDNFGYLDVIAGAGGVVNITGDIGATGGANELGLMNIESGHVVLQGDSWINNFMFFGADTELTVSADKTLNIATNGVRTNVDNQGTFNLGLGATLNGNIGEVGAVLNEVNANATSSTSTFNGNVYATTMNITGTASTNGNVVLDGNLYGDLNYQILSNNSGLSAADGQSIAIVGSITTENDGIGRLKLLDGGSVTGQIGTASAALGIIFAGASGTTVFDSDVYVGQLNVMGTGSVRLGADFEGDINFYADGNLYTDNPLTISGDVTTNNNGTGYMYLGKDVQMDGTIGSATHKLDRVLFSSGMGGGGTTNVANDVYANDIDLEIGTVMNVLADITFGGNFDVDSYAPNYVTVLDIASNKLTVSGDFTLDHESVLNVDILSDATYGSIDVAGTATIPAGVAVDVTTSGNYISDGATFKVVDGAAGAGVIGGNTVTDDNNFVTFTATHLDNQDLILTAARSSSGYVPHAASSNTTTVATVLDTMAGKDSDFDTVLSVIDTLDTNTSEMDDAFEQLGEDASAGTKNTVVIAHNDSVKTISARMSSMRSAGLNGVAAGDVEAELEAWGQVFGSYQDQGTRDDIQGYDANVYGCVIGADRAVTDSIRAGLSLSYADSVVDFKKVNMGDTEIESYQASLYASYQQADAPWYLSTLLSYGFNDYEGYRNINFGAINRRANSDYDGQQYSLNIAGGYDFKFNDLYLSPMASLQYMRLEVDGYTETGADSLNLIVDSKDYDFLDLEIGAELKYPVYLADSDLTLVPSFYAMYAYEFIGDKELISSRFSGGGAAFNTEGAKPAKSSLRYGASLAMVFSDSISLDLSYSGKVKDEYIEHNASATVRMKF